MSWAVPDPPIRVHLRQGVPAPSDGEFYSTEDARKLLLILVERRLKSEILEAEIIALRATLEVAEGRINVLNARVAEEMAEAEVQKARRQTWVERHIGFCAGPYAGYDFTTDEVGAGVGILYGFRF